MIDIQAIQDSVDNLKRMDFTSERVTGKAALVNIDTELLNLLLQAVKDLRGICNSVESPLLKDAIKASKERYFSDE